MRVERRLIADFYDRGGHHGEASEGAGEGAGEEVLGGAEGGEGGGGVASAGGFVAGEGGAGGGFTGVGIPRGDSRAQVVQRGEVQR